MGMSSRDSAKYSAYKAVNAVSQEELLNSEYHMDILNNALKRLWEYEGLYPNETDALRDERLDLASPADGEAYELGVHFKQLYPEINGTGWTVIFSVYNRMQDLFKGEEGVKPVSIENESSEININNSFSKKEDINMSDLVNTLDALNAELATSLGSSVKESEGSLPGDDAPSTATREAAGKAIEKAKSERLNYTQNASIKKVVLNKPAARYLVVTKEGEPAVGKVTSPAKAYEAFTRKFDVDTTTNPVTFKKCAPGGIENATKIYDLLVAAKTAEEAKTEGPDIELNDSKSTGSIAGVLLQGPNEAPAYVTLSTLKSILMEKAMGVIDVDGGVSQFMVGKVRTTKKKPTTGHNNQKKAMSGYDGVVAVKIANRKALMEQASMIEYVNQVKESQPAEMKPGVKSKLSAQFKLDTVNAKGEPQYRTWRIPCSAVQLVTEADLEHFGGVFTASSAGVARSTVKVNLSNQEDLAKIQAELTELMAISVTKGGNSEVQTKIKEASAASEEAEAAKTAEAFADLA